MRISQVGEFGLINLLNKAMINSPTGVVAGIGDDAAVLKVSGDQWQLFTTDMLVEGIHFRLDWASYFDVGWKALAVNISDIAAMGGKPTHGVISLGIPAETRVEDMEELYRGLRAVARRFGVNLVGGDTVKCPERLVINVALLGEVAAGKAILRSGARPGDIIYTTGTLGTAAAGLHILLNGGNYPDPIKETVLRAHLRPEPRVQAGTLLSSLPGVTALDDNSDGLAAELREIGRASGVGCLIWEKALPVAAEVQQLAALTGADILDWVMNGGEDFELVFTVQPAYRKQVEAALTKAAVDFAAIGVITSAREGLIMERVNGTREAMGQTGYNHFTD